MAAENSSAREFKFEIEGRRERHPPDDRTHQILRCRAVDTRLNDAKVAEGLGASIDRPRCGAHSLHREQGVTLVGPKSLPRLAVRGALELPVAELVTCKPASELQGMLAAATAAAGRRRKECDGRRLPAPPEQLEEEERDNAYDKAGFLWPKLRNLGQPSQGVIL